MPLELTGTFQLELALGEKAMLGLGVTAWGIQTYSPAAVVTDGPAASSVSLFTGRELRPAPPDAPARADAPPFDRPLPALAPRQGNDLGWMSVLGRLADTTGVALYADAYREEQEIRYANSSQLKGGSLGRALDQFCGDSYLATSGSFWWRRGEAALIRSRKCLWQSAGKLPGPLVERMHARFIASRDREGLQPEELAMLASLTTGKVVGLVRGGHFGNLPAWRYAVQLSSGLSKEARAAYLRNRTSYPLQQYELSWETLPDADRQALLALPDPPLRDGTPVLKVKLELFGGYSGTVIQEYHVSLTLDAEWGASRTRLNLSIPVNGVQDSSVLVTDPARVNRPLPERPRLVCARYYPWFGLPERSGSLQHLEGISAAEGKIKNFWQYPRSGAYDSTDEGTLSRHARELKEAGVEVLVCPWFGPDDQTGKALPKLLPAAREQGLRVCVSLAERMQWENPRATATLLHAKVAALKPLIQDPAYLRLGNQPVLFIDPRIQAAFDQQGWADALVRWEKELGTPLVVMATGETEREGEIFNGLFLRPPSAYVLREPGAKVRERLVADGARLAALARPRIRLAAATVVPGMTTRYQSRDKEEIVAVDRAGGRLYSESWEAALKASPDWILIESFNNWESNTQIEPSAEEGDRYLKLTAEYARRFKRPEEPKR